MAQSSIFHASGLERDYRQDEYPTRQDEFPTRQDEFPMRQDEFPTAYRPNSQTLNHEDPRALSSEINAKLPLHKPVTKPRGCLCGLPKSTFWLVATLLVLLLVIGIGAGVLGSRMRISEQKSNASPSRFSTTSPSSTITSPATSSPTSPSSSTPIPVVKQLLPPENDCGAVVPQYTVHALTFRGDTVNAQFSVSCDADFGGGDFMSFYSPSLTTCMHGCAMFNYWQTVYKNHLELNCSGVTYAPGAFGEGNCWLKPWGYNTAVTEKKACSYARLNR